MTDSTYDYFPIQDPQVPLSRILTSCDREIIGCGDSEFEASHPDAATLAIAELKSPVECSLVPIGEAGRWLWTKTPIEITQLVASLRLDSFAFIRRATMVAQPSGMTLGTFIASLTPKQIKVTSVIDSLRMYSHSPALSPVSQALSAGLSERIETQCGEGVEGTALRAGLYQMHGDLDRSHELAQSIEGRGTPRNGDYWHAIMHRREQDFSNAKYWFRHVGSHPVAPHLREYAIQILKACPDPSAEKWLQQFQSSRWEPATFVDLCQTCRKDEESPLARAAREIQWFEMVLLLSVCAAGH